MRTISQEIFDLLQVFSGIAFAIPVRSERPACRKVAPMKSFAIASVAVVLSVAWCGGALAQDLRDAAVELEVTHTISSAARLGIFDHVDAHVTGGTVVLTGMVTTAGKKQEAEARLAQLDGVRSIRNDIRVLPASRADDDLRYRVARAIYGNATFWNYAAMANPPIHIIVEGGHVTLVGVVNDNVERTLARSLATGLGERSVTNALRTSAERKGN